MVTARTQTTQEIYHFESPLLFIKPVTVIALNTNYISVASAALVYCVADSYIFIIKTESPCPATVYNT